MRVTLDALLVLDAIDKAGSFAGGAEQLYRVPSAVSYTIHKLEQDLGVVIFDRSKHRAQLTKAGAQLLEDGRALLRLVEEVERKAKAVGAGWNASIAIAVADVIPRSAIHSLLRSFYQIAGNERTHVLLTTEGHANGWDALLEGRADLVIGAALPAPNVDGFSAQSLGDVDLALVMPTDHPLAGAPEPVSAGDCCAYRFIKQKASPFRNGHDDGRDGLLVVDDYDSQLEAIRHGLGIGYAPANLVRDDVVCGRLMMKNVVNAPRLSLATAWRTSRSGQELQWFLEQLRDDDVRAQLVCGAERSGIEV